MPNLIEIVLPEQKQGDIKIESETVIVVEIISFFRTAEYKSSRWSLNHNHLPYVMFGENITNIVLEKIELGERKNGKNNPFSLIVTFEVDDEGEPLLIDETFEVTSAREIDCFPPLN
jgi:hypothetical protein